MSALLFHPRAPLPQSDHRVPTHGMAEQPGLQQDLAAVMTVVREVVDEEARRVVGEPHDPATRRDRRRYHRRVDRSPPERHYPTIHAYPLGFNARDAGLVR